jgi:hypothetical protein
MYHLTETCLTIQVGSSSNPFYSVIYKNEYLYVQFLTFKMELIEMENNNRDISEDRELVLNSYRNAEIMNNRAFRSGDEKATEQYIFPNQKEDANKIVEEFYKNNRRVVSITKKTKVGMDGLMIEIAKLMTTHPDDNFVVDVNNVRIITGMSNAGWEKDMKEKAPDCFKNKIFHHGQLKNSNIKNFKNALIIIDEIDTGNGELQVLHQTLNEAGVLNKKNMIENNNRFVFASATMLKELRQLYDWNELHYLFKMSIPNSYIGHIEFLNKGIIKEFYQVDSLEKAKKWVQEDILDNYGSDYRVHIIRVTNKTVKFINDACIIIDKGIRFRNHTSDERLTEDEIKEIFKEPLIGHIVLGVKGFFRRANLIPNKWKLRIGATHELFQKTRDNNVQIQGLPGRMTGYWKEIIDNGHKTGPYRTSILAVNEYEKAFNDPFGEDISYRSSGLIIDNGSPKRMDNTMVSVHNISEEDANHTPTGVVESAPKYTVYVNEFKSMEDLNVYWKDISKSSKNCLTPRRNEYGKYTCALGSKSSVHTVSDIRSRRYDTGTHEWGSGITDFKDKPSGSYIARVYAGYDGEIPVFFLRWTVKS